MNPDNSLLTGYAEVLTLTLSIPFLQLFLFRPARYEGKVPMQIVGGVCWGRAFGRFSWYVPCTE